MNRIIVIGASGHGKVVADIAKLNGYDEIVFLDDNDKIKECVGCPVLGPLEMLRDIVGDVFVAIGNSKIRRMIMEREINRSFPVLIHPSAVISEDVVINKGTVIMAGVVINPSTVIGKGCIINTASSIDHDCMIHDYCHIAVGSHLCGTVVVDNNTWIGAGSTISNNVIICNDCIIGAGSVVLHDIVQSGIYMGVPVHKKQEVRND